MKNVRNMVLCHFWTDVWPFLNGTKETLKLNVLVEIITKLVNILLKV